MGRPPIGKTAMTEAERKRRQRALLRDKRVTQPASPRERALAKQLAQAEARIAELEAKLRKGKPSRRRAAQDAP
jgi:hypothetical protein